jgi:flagellar biosynthesis chaperone FliJ
MSNDKKVDDIDLLLGKANEQTKKFIKQLESEEKHERVETIDSIVNDIKATKTQTELNKDRFINEIKSGLGQTIKEKPNDVRIIKKTWYQKLKIWIKNIFTKF